MVDIKGAKIMCDLDISPEKEQAFQMNDNNFLIYSTNDEDVSLSCNSIAREIRKHHKGILVYKIPTVCALKLETIYFMFTLCLES